MLSENGVSQGCMLSTSGPRQPNQTSGPQFAAVSSGRGCIGGGPCWLLSALGPGVGQLMTKSTSGSASPGLCLLKPVFDTPEFAYVAASLAEVKIQVGGKVRKKRKRALAGVDQ